MGNNKAKRRKKTVGCVSFIFYAKSYYKKKKEKWETGGNIWMYMKDKGWILLILKEFLKLKKSYNNRKMVTK